MRYNELEHLSNPEFKRLCGVSRSTFSEMVEVLRPVLDRRGQRGGQAKLGVEDQLLVALDYWREYRAPVSHRGELGITRNHSWADCAKSGRPFGQMWPVSATEPTPVVPTRLGVEGDDGRCRGDRNRAP